MDINYALFMPPPPRRASKSLVATILGSFGLLALSAVIVAGILMSSYSRGAASPAALGASMVAGAPEPTPAGPAPATAALAPTPAAPAAAPAPEPVEQVTKAKPARKRIARHRSARAAKTRAAKARSGKRVKGPDAALRKLLGI